MSYYFSFLQSCVKLISEAKIGHISFLSRCDLVRKNILSH